jgi:hypothetical protein
MDGDESVGEVETPAEDEVLDTSSGAEVTETSEAAPEAPAASPWDQFKQIPAFQGKDDAEIASSVYQALQRQQQIAHQLRQYQSIVPVASEYLSNREMYERWKQSQGQPAAQQAAAPAAQPTAEEQGWWNPPKIRDAYRQYLIKDEQGREVISPDAPLDARHALAEYQTYRAEFAKKFLENPEETLAPMVAKVAEQRAQQLIQSQLARRDEEQFVMQVESENQDWLRDEQGNVSREALLAQKYVEDAKRYGIQGAKPRWEFAKAMVERELLLDFYSQATSGGQVAPQAAPQQQPPVDSAARQNMEFLRQQAKRTPPRGSPGTSDPRVPKPKTTFAEKLQSQLAEEGLL